CRARSRRTARKRRTSPALWSLRGSRTCCGKGRTSSSRSPRTRWRARARGSPRTSRCPGACSSAFRARAGSGSPGGSPTTPRGIADDGERDRLGTILGGFPPGSGGIARPAAQGCGVEDFLADRAYLEELAARTRRKAENASAPLPIHRELDLPLRSIRDLVTSDFDAILGDDGGVRDRIVESRTAAAPGLAGGVELEGGSPPLFSRLGVEEEIENALKNRVALKSGGSVVVQQTEALVAIDV